MSFNFGSLAEVKISNGGSYLKPYSINEGVTIKSTEIKEGTSAAGNSWKSLVITFANEEGEYSDSIFWITSEKDFQRTKLPMANGGERELPSSWERTRDKMAAIGKTFFPESFAKLQAVAGKAKSFDEIALAFKKCADAAVGKNPTSMKLVGRNSNGRVFATLPNCTGIAQATDAKRAADNDVEVGAWYTWVSSPFGDNLSFSAYELSQKNAMENAKPTNMDNVETENSTDFDTSSLLDLDL